MPSFNTRGSDYYAAVEMAVKTTGTGALNDLEAAFRANGQALQALQGMYASGAIKLDEFREETAKFKREQAELTEAIAAANRVLNGQPAALDKTKTGFQGATQAALAFSRGLEDLSTGGFIGILNNLPGMARGVGTAFSFAAPQVALLETAVSLVGTGSYVLYKNWGTLKALIDAGMSPKPIEDLKGLRKELEALTSKQWVTGIDLRDIDALTEKVEKLSEIEAALRAQRGPSDDEKARGDLFNKAVKATGQPDRFQDAVSSSMGPVEDSAETLRMRDQIRQQREYMQGTEFNLLNKATLGGAQAYHENFLGQMLAKLDQLKANDQQRRDQAVKEIVGRAGTGSEPDRKLIADLMDKNAQRFRDFGFGADIRAAIEKASPDAQAKTKAEEKAKKGDEAVEKEAAAIGDQPVKDVEEIVRKYRQAFMDRLEADMYDTLKAVPPADRVATSKRLVDAREKAIAGELSALTGFSPTDMRSIAPARKLLEEGAVGGMNAIAASDPPKLVKERERDQAKATADEVKRLAPGVADQVEKALLTRQARGANPEDAARGVLPSLMDWVNKQGVAADKLDKVTQGILDKGKVGVAQDLAKLGPIPLQEAAQRQLLTVLDKIEAKLTSDQKRAAGNDNNRQVQAFANAYQGMTGESDARSLDAGRRAAKWFGDGYSEDESLQAAMLEMGEMGVERGERRQQLGRGGRPADRQAREAKAAQLKAGREAKKRRDAEWHRRMGKGAGPAPENGNGGGGLMSVPPSMPAADVEGSSDPKAPAPSMGANSGVVGVLQQVTAVTSNLARQQDQDGAKFVAMMSHLAMVRQQQERNINRLPSLFPSSPWIR